MEKRNKNKNERKDRASSNKKTEHGQIVSTKGITKTDQALPHLLILSLADYFVVIDPKYIKWTPVFQKREFHLLQVKSTLSFDLSMDHQLLLTNCFCSTLNLRVLFFSNHTNVSCMALDLKTFILNVGSVVYTTESAHTTIVMNASLNINTKILKLKSFLLNVALVVQPTELARTTLVLNASFNINSNVLDLKTIMLNTSFLYAKYLFMPTWIKDIGKDRIDLDNCSSKSIEYYIFKNPGKQPERKEDIVYFNESKSKAGKEHGRNDFYWKHFCNNPQTIFAYPVLHNTMLHVEHVFNVKVKENKKESYRLQTFKPFPTNAEQHPITLAANGFIYTGFGVSDETTCFYCMKSYKNWRYTDDIKSTHLRISPTCPMALGLKCVNVPISTRNMLFHLPMELTSSESLTLNSPTGENLTRSREAFSSVQNTNQAGGFQVSDRFTEGAETTLPICFYCNVPYSSTDDGQDIIIAHIKYSPSCGYVRLKMGHNYVETVLELATQQTQITQQMIRDRMNLPIAVRDRMNSLHADRDRVNLPRDVRDRMNSPRAIAFYPVTGGRYLQPGLTRAQVPHLENVSDLQAENNWRFSRLTCKICQRKEVKVMFIPCGHVITCVECSLLPEFCNNCHSRIEGKARIFFE